MLFIRHLHPEIHVDLVVFIDHGFVLLLANRFRKAKPEPVSEKIFALPSKESVATSKKPEVGWGLIFTVYINTLGNTRT